MISSYFVLLDILKKTTHQRLHGGAPPFRTPAWRGLEQPNLHFDASAPHALQWTLPALRSLCLRWKRFCGSVGSIKFRCHFERVGTDMLWP